MSKKKMRESGWLPVMALAQVFDISDSQARTLADACVNDEFKRTRDKKTEYYCRAVIENWARQHGAKLPVGFSITAQTQMQVGDAEELDPKTRLTIAQAELAELKLAQGRGSLIPRDVVHRWLGEVAGVVQRGLQRERLTPNDGKHIEEMLAELHGKIDELAAGALTVVPTDDEIPALPGKPRGRSGRRKAVKVEEKDE